MHDAGVQIRDYLGDFVLGILKWVQSVQMARRRAYRLREAIQAKMGAGLEYDEGDEGEILIN